MMDDQRLLQVIDSTPLVSIDLILLDSQGWVLLGKRTNRPALDYWFVPGGRIRKNERIAEAFKRISLKELGCELSLENAELLGGYDHIYDDNYLNREGVNTHYVVLAYRVMVPDDWSPVVDEQHSEMRAWSIAALLKDPQVHFNTKAYFTEK
jgi:colanic acid biosynthesis protein WcaH